MSLRQQITIDPEPYKRWYEENKHLEYSIRLLMLFSAPVNQVMLRVFKAAGQANLKATAEQLSVQSVGQEKIMGLFKSKRKRRAYDKDPVLHEIMNQYWMLYPEDKGFMTTLIFQSVYLMYEYMKQFVIIDSNPALDEIARLSQVHLAEKTKINSAFFEDLEAFLFQSLAEPNRKIKPVLTRSKFPTFENVYYQNGLITVQKS